MKNTKDLQKNIVGITIGIKFARSFRVPDISGDIIDNILYSKETPFGAKFFPKVQENSNREKTIFNPETSDYLRINTDDLILGINIDDDFQKRFDWLKNDVLNYLRNVLFHKYQIKNVRRIGIIFSHKISKNKKLNEAISLLTNNKLTGVNNIDISFSKKNPVRESLYRKGVNDYKNTIYNFNEMKETLLTTLDYQYYFEPIIEDLRECFVEKILNDAKNFLENDYYLWLSQYEDK
ncbi:MAG: hypothetical protein KAV41_02240 [Candidatus Pacebacteria bacterium]|nr:hypothetical protein [Candidatus Paceibacterota bacterium]